MNEIYTNTNGVQELFPLASPNDDDYNVMCFDEIENCIKEKKKVVASRLRFVTNIGTPFYDLSYFQIYVDSVKYNVEHLPFEQIPKSTKRANYNDLKRNLYKVIKLLDSPFPYIENIFESISFIE